MDKVFSQEPTLGGTHQYTIVPEVPGTIDGKVDE
jgi:hypothetical protein